MLLGPFTVSSFLPFWMPSCPVTITRWMQANANRVKDVISDGQIFQVFYVVVQLISIFVIYMVTRWAWADKSQCDKAVDSRISLNTKSFKRDGRIAILINLLFQNLAGVSNLANAYVSNLPVITNLVGIFQTDYRFPLFYYARIAFSQGVNLRLRFTKWLGSLCCSNSWRAVSILPQMEV